MTVFVVAVLALVLIAGAALLWPALGRGADPLRARRKALQEAYASGVLSKDEFDAKSATLAAEAVTPTPTDRGRSGSRRLLVALAAALPLAAIALYFAIGRPDALSTSATSSAAASQAADGMPSAAGQKPGMDMEAAIGSLRAKLEKNPGDADGWLLLGRAYESVGRNDDGRKALEKAYALAPDKPAVEIAYAEAMALARADRRIDGEPLRMIRHALQVEPDNQDGLWLLGMSHYQQGRYAEAIAAWEKIRAQLGPDSDVLQSVTGMIADAKAHLDGTAAAAMPVAAGPAQAVASAGAGELRLRVSLADALRARAAPSDTVFVFARAVGGPPMPVAIKRLQVSALPADVVLSDADAMVPTMRLSGFPKVTVSARISKSGDAIAHSGDLQAKPVEASTSGSATLSLTIDGVVP